MNNYKDGESGKGQISVRLDPELKQLLEDICKVRKEDVSTFTRLALMQRLAKMGYLSDVEKKALGLDEK